MNPAQPQPVPYQAYKSKRHSRNLSATFAPIVSPPSRPSSVGSLGSNGTTFSPSSTPSRDTPLNGVKVNGKRRPKSMVGLTPSLDPPPSTTSSEGISPATNGVQSKSQKPKQLSPKMFPTSLPNGSCHPDPPPPERPPQPGPSSASADPEPSSSSKPPEPTQKSPPHTRKTSTFRRIPLREARPALSSSPLRSSHTQTSSAPPSALPSASPLRSTSPLRTGSPLRNSVIMEQSPPPPILSPLMLGNAGLVSEIPVSDMLPPPVQPTRSPSPLQPPPPPPKSVPTRTAGTPPLMSSRSTSGSTLASTATSPVSSISRTATPISNTSKFYRPGFQPKGVYRPRTDEFAEARKSRRGAGKIEQTRLERRLEKLINLHFSDPPEKPKTPQPPQVRQRKSSLFMDFSELRGKSASELWKDMITSQAQNEKSDVRAAEQRITPWEEDSAVSQCPLCLASFHPITNRKHHCRLCGRIICSLPVRRPQRPVTCSLLFVANTKTGVIEEVGEGIDYGIRKRTASTMGPGKGGQPPRDDEKFLSGVRICRECRPVLLRQQYIREANSTPVFAQLYNLLIGIEKEVEDSLPQFQELLLSLNNDERPTAEASAARKRLVEAFAHYDAAAKRIRSLPCAKGSSQDRVQTTILARANLFLQKNMFPLQSLPKPARKTNSSCSTPSTLTLPLNETTIDPDSELAHALQPLLEQEALLETFVQEATTRRKFEDAQILRENLKEIRGEIDRIVANAEREQARGKGKGRT